MHIKLWGEENLSLATQLMFENINSSDYGVEHVIIVPDRFSLLAEKKLLNILPNGILFNVKVTTFSAFTQQLLQQAGVLSELASAGERLLYIQKAAQEELSVFQKKQYQFLLSTFQRDFAAVFISSFSWRFKRACKAHASKKIG